MNSLSSSQEIPPGSPLESSQELLPVSDQGIGSQSSSVTSGWNIDINTIIVQQLTQSPPSRCEFPACKKKINPLHSSIYKCACKKFFCAAHKLSHGCTFNYRKRFKKQLSNSLMGNTASKHCSGHHRPRPDECH